MQSFSWLHHRQFFFKIIIIIILIETHCMCVRVEWLTMVNEC